jgi:hypothetical protein
MPLIHLGVAVAAHHQRAGALQLAAHKPQQRQRRHIRPVQVVDDQQQRAAAGRRPQETCEAVEQPGAGGIRLQRRPHQHKRAARGRLGGQLLGQPGLADAGFAGQQHHPTTASDRGIQVGGQLGQLPLTAHKRCRHRQTRSPS